VCGKAFSQSRTLNKHMPLHMREKL